MANSDSESGTEPSPTLLHSLRRLLGTWVAVLGTRIDLAATEIEEERERAQQLMLLAAISSLCIGLGALLITLFVVMLFWETDYRLVVLGALAVIYLAAGIIVGFVTRQKSRQRSRFLSATLGELAKDYQHLSS